MITSKMSGPQVKVFRGEDFGRAEGSGHGEAMETAVDGSQHFSRPL